MAAVKKTFRFTNEMVIEHLNKQPNQSKYIEELIKKDMSPKDRFITKDEAIALIESYLKNIQAKQSIADDKVKQSIQNIINWGAK